MSDSAFRAEVRHALTVPRAIGTWLYTVVLFSALALLGPLFIPPLHNGFSMSLSFGNGELLSFALALFAAAISRWIVHGGDGGLLKALSMFGME